MSTANQVPETWELTGDDAVETLGAPRSFGGSSETHSSGSGTPTASATPDRSPISTTLVFLEGIIALVGFAIAIGSGALSD